MPQFSDVALPIPVEGAFTYSIPESLAAPAIGARVLVPFRNRRQVGVVTALHESRPGTLPAGAECKPLISVLDSEPLVSAELLRLAEWIASYYLAPLGEVLRAMLPLGAQLRRERLLRLTEKGREALHVSATRGARDRARKPVESQADELRALDLIAQSQEMGEEMKESVLVRAGRFHRAIVAGLLRKKWIHSEEASRTTNLERAERFATLADGDNANAAAPKRTTPQQQAILDHLRAGERVPLAELHARGFSASALRTLTQRGRVRMVEQPKTFALSSVPGIAPPRVELTSAQQDCLANIQAAMARGKFEVALLHGVTGSGKTAVYLAAMEQALAAGRGAILLVPEIGLTPAAVANLQARFGQQVALLHSALTPAERAQEWQRIRSGAARIAVGTRSAIFAPVRAPALIVVDEEHDTSYKQEETPRYHGRDVAVMRAKLEGAVVVLSSATPALESFYNAQRVKYRLLELRRRIHERPLPEVEILDMRAEFQETGEQHLFSRKLAEAIRERLQRGEQAMILLNRRGYSSAVLCRACGETAQCRDCAIALTHHKRSTTLECHYCGYRRAVPRRCPQCDSEQLFFMGAGSERLEERLSAEFPQARIGRLDRDSARRRGYVERTLAAFHAGELDLLVGTQMIAKGHDVHGVTLVGVVGADFALGFPDFRAAERTFQLLTQVAGRAGRGEAPGKVILQTYFPEHYAIQFAARHDYAGFCEKELRFRTWMKYPPFSALANVLIRSPKLEQALAWAGIAGEWLRDHPAKDLRALGPAAAPLVRLKRDYRYQFILKSASRERLNATLRGLLAHCAQNKIPRTNVIVDVDPVSLL